MDEEDSAGQTPKKAKFPEALSLVPKQSSSPEPIAGANTQDLSRKKGQTTTLVAVRDKQPQSLVNQGYDLTTYLLQGLIFIGVSNQPHSLVLGHAKNLANSRPLCINWRSVDGASGTLTPVVDSLERCVVGVFGIGRHVCCLKVS